MLSSRSLSHECLAGSHQSKSNWWTRDPITWPHATTTSETANHCLSHRLSRFVSVLSNSSAFTIRVMEATRIAYRWIGGRNSVTLITFVRPIRL